MGNWANTPHPKPGSNSAVNLHKSLAAGATMPASKRCVKVDLKGSSTGKVKTPGLSSR